MKIRIRKAVQILCTWLMAITLIALPVSATGEEENSEAKTNANAIELSYEVTIKSHQEKNWYTAYQIFAGKVTGNKLVDVSWGDGIDTSTSKTLVDDNGNTLITGLETDQSYNFVAALKASDTLDDTFKDLNSAEEIAQKLDTLTTADNAQEIAEFAKIAKYFLKGDGTSTDKSGGTKVTGDSAGTSDYTYTITLDKPGYYLIVDNGVTESGTQSTITSGAILTPVFSSSEATEVSTKAEIPGMVKKVKEDSGNDTSRYGAQYNDAADYSIGDTVTFRMIGSLTSDFTQYKKDDGSIYYTYKFHDTFGTNSAGEPVFNAVIKNYTGDSYTTATDMTNYKADNVKIWISKGLNVDDVTVGKMRYWEVLNNYNLLTKGQTATKEWEPLLYRIENTDKTGNVISTENNNTGSDPYGFILTITKGGGAADSTSSSTSGFDDSKISSALESIIDDGYKYVVVEYQCVLNKNAVIGLPGNVNTAQLEYSDDYNSSHTSFTAADSTVVFTYGLQGTKVDGKDNTKLSGAKFKLSYKDSEGEHWAIFSNGGYVTDWTTDAVKANTVTSAPTTGIFTIYGLDEGDYTLEEDTAPAGYNKLDKNIRFTISSNKLFSQEYNGTNASAMFEDAQNALTLALTNDTDSSKFTTVTGTGSAEAGLVYMTIKNNAGVTLPSTGASGTRMLYIVGGIAVLVTGVYLVTKRRADAMN